MDRPRPDAGGRSLTGQRSPTALHWTVVAAVVAAGCLSGAGPADDGDAAGEASGPVEELPEGLGALPDGTPAPTTMTWRNCANHVGLFPYPMETLQGMLPSGFAPMPYPNDPTGEAGSWFISSHPCDNTEDLWVGIAVVPPAELAGDAAFHYVPLRVVTTNGTIQDIFAAWNFPVVDQPDTMVIELYDAEPAARAGRTRAVVPGLEVDLGTLVQGPPTDGQPRTSRGYGIRDGDVVNAVDVSWGDHRIIDDSGEAGAEIETDLFPFLPPFVGGYGRHIWGGFDYEWEFVALLGADAGGATT